MKAPNLSHNSTIPINVSYYVDTIFYNSSTRAASTQVLKVTKGRPGCPENACSALSCTPPSTASIVLDHGRCHLPKLAIMVRNLPTNRRVRAITKKDQRTKFRELCIQGHYRTAKLVHLNPFPGREHVRAGQIPGLPREAQEMYLRIPPPHNVGDSLSIVLLWNDDVTFLLFQHPQLEFSRKDVLAVLPCRTVALALDLSGHVHRCPVRPCKICPFSIKGDKLSNFWDQDTRSVLDENGAVEWVFTSEEKPDERYEAYSPTYMPWQDTIVRLSYIHMVDNLIHVLWLRFYQSSGPYTSYLNNSELFTLLLFIQMGLYTYSRIKSHVIFTHGDDEEMVIDVEKTTPV